MSHGFEFATPTPLVERMRQDDGSLRHESTKTSLWPRTEWPKVRAAAIEVGQETRHLSDLILRYQKPLRVYLFQQFRAFPEVMKNSDELLQDFTTDKFLAKGWLDKANCQRGRFRDFLKISFKRYVMDRGKKPRLLCVPLDELQGQGQEPSAPEAPSEEFDLAWTRSVLEETLEKMEADCRSGKREQPRNGFIWELFRLRLLEPIFQETKPVPYEALVERFGLRSPTEASNMLLTAKRMFERHLNAVIAEYEGSDQGRKAELAELTEFVARLAKRK